MATILFGIVCLFIFPPLGLILLILGFAQLILGIGKK